jgi:hypothetical protein
MKGKQEMHKQKTTPAQYTNATTDDKTVIIVNVKSADGRMESILHLTRKDAETLMEEIRHKLMMVDLSEMMAVFED